MKFIHHGHACVELENDRGQRLLIDPGSLAESLDGLAQPDAVLITHGHEDHLQVEQLRSAVSDPDTPIHAPAETRQTLDEAGFENFNELTTREVAIGDFGISVFESPHEVIHPGLPLPANFGLHIDSKIFHPGDSLTVPPHEVDVLLFPLGAPWLKLTEVISYVTAVAPRIAIPIHQGGLAEAHRVLHTNLVRKFSPERTTVLTPAPGESILL